MVDQIVWTRRRDKKSRSRCHQDVGWVSLQLQQFVDIVSGKQSRKGKHIGGSREKYFERAIIIILEARLKYNKMYNTRKNISGKIFLLCQLGPLYYGPAGGRAAARSKSTFQLPCKSRKSFLNKVKIWESPWLFGPPLTTPLAGGWQAGVKLYQLVQLLRYLTLIRTCHTGLENCPVSEKQTLFENFKAFSYEKFWSPGPHLVFIRLSSKLVDKIKKDTV